jgi:hypothetical protein
MTAGHHNGFNPFRDAHGRWATPSGHAEAIHGPPAAPGAEAIAIDPRSLGASYTPAAAAALRHHEDSIRANDFETGVIVSAAGQVLLNKRGKSAVVKFNKTEAKLLIGAIITHNHPVDKRSGAETSFSAEDIIHGMASGESEVRAVTPTFTHVIQWRKTGTHQPLNQAMSDDVLGDVLGTMYTRYGEAMGTTRGMPKPQAKALLEQTAHQVNKELAQQYGYVYYRENIVTGETDGYGT